MFNRMVNSGYFMYMAEAEGHSELVSTRAAKINAIIKDFKSLIDRGLNPNEYIYEVLTSHGLNENLLTEAEIEKINRVVNDYA